MPQENNKRVLVAMSGGVDSSVAAALLARDGFEPVGVTMRLLPRGGEGFGCCGSPDDLLIAKRSAERIGIPHYILDYYPDFETKVIDYFVDSYLSGETPNPCLACNRHIKFDKLQSFAASIDARFLATGHYAEVVEADDGFHLYEAADPRKDQSYVLHHFDQKGLSTTLFPVGSRPKPEIRDLAREFGLPNAEKKDSQEICFVPARDYRGFIRAKLDERGGSVPTSATPGPIRDESGAVIGEHRGAAFYTVGQRSGLGLSGVDRRYVTRIDARTNTIHVGTDAASMAAGLEAADVNWIAGHAPGEAFDAFIKIRYKHEPVPCRVELTDSGFRARLEIPKRAVTPGQAAVLYRLDPARGRREVIGGGKITGPL